jgi:Flp pilus assembly pilin Flp
LIFVIKVVDIKRLIGIILLEVPVERSPTQCLTNGNEKKMSANKNKNLSREERGTDISEYVLAAALIALVIIMAFTDLGTMIADKISEWKNAMIGN